MHKRITRTIKVICMSRFLHFVPASLTDLIISLYPDFAPVHTTKLLYHDNFLAPLPVCTATLHQCC